MNNPSRPKKKFEDKDDRAPKKRMSEAELWELKQLIASGAISVAERPDLDEINGILNFDEEEEEVEIELNEDEPPFLRGQTTASREISPIKVVKVAEGDLARAALTQSALAKERREMRDQQRLQQLDAVPKDLVKPFFRDVNRCHKPDKICSLAVCVIEPCVDRSHGPSGREAPGSRTPRHRYEHSNRRARVEKGDCRKGSLALPQHCSRRPLRLYTLFAPFRAFLCL